ncbi:ABC transporter substrate-binding protein [Halolamina salifodinae]|uniref:ABC-type Fe3+-hydroxamate transport system substrate-binding protein n=1 Tax=Halolamina salifodinae TaxID=1202767 RepID=A0A8T4GX40_9EURY|nr:ABC transporter substrate-binding protein [Halolamina salifodinae]MBP1987030.1 ABC-type Fe3+-hydroxamate transport system substrate-binding protein [Halolamina salifodinae]
MTDSNLTRRQYLTYGSAIAASGLLAGCIGGDGTDTPAGEGTDEPTESGDGTVTPSSHTASMAPVGEVEFDSVPENVMVYSLLYADLAVAYGHGDAVNSLGFSAEAGGNTLDAYYERLPGVSFDHEGIEQLNSGNSGVTIDKELLYELNSDLHLADPCLVMGFDGWEEADVDEIRENVGPWFGNTLSRRNAEPPEACADDYEYYTLWQIAETVADVFQSPSAYEELAAVHDDLRLTIEADLPPEEERPTVASVIFMQDTFYPSRIDTAGFSNAHVRPLGAVDAFDSAEISYQTAYDYEQMLEIDPDIILHRYGINSYYDVGSISQTIADHAVGGDLTAAQNGRIYPGGHPVQGPLMNLFQIEMTAKQLYPEQFGEWPGYTHGEPYPEIPEEERLFDRQRVADAVSGE